MHALGKSCLNYPQYYNLFILNEYVLLQSIVNKQGTLVGISAFAVNNFLTRN